MADRIDYLLSRTSLPLSFIVFIPQSHFSISGNSKLENSTFYRGGFTVEYGNHQYISGFQHVSKKCQNLYTAAHTSHVFFLQNNNGFGLWPPNEQNLIKLKNAMKIIVI